MTAPNINKPNATTDKYQDVYGKGSRFGQDLSEDSVRRMLIGRDRSPFDSALSGFVKVVEDIFKGIGGIIGGAVNAAVTVGGAAIKFVVDGVKNLITGVSKVIGHFLNGGRRSDLPRELPAIYSPIAADLEGALKPINDKIDQALTQSRGAQGRAAEAITEMQSLLDPNNTNSQLWKLQDQINKGFQEAHENHTAAIDAFQEALNTTVPYISRLIVLDSNTGSVENEHIKITRGGTKTNGYFDVYIKPGWSGNWVFNGMAYANGNYTNEPVIGVGTAGIGERSLRFSSSRNGGTVGPGYVSYVVSGARKRTHTFRDNARRNAERSYFKITEFRMPVGGQATVKAHLEWEQKVYLGTYDLQIRVNGSNRTTTSSSPGAPLFGSRLTKHSAAVAPTTLRKGDVISLWAKADSHEHPARVYKNTLFQVDYLDPNG